MERISCGKKEDRGNPTRDWEHRSADQVEPTWEGVKTWDFTWTFLQSAGRYKIKQRLDLIHGAGFVDRTSVCVVVMS